MSVYPGVCGGYGIPGPPGPPGPPGLDVGGRINVPPQPVPTTPGIVTIVAAPGLTGATVIGNVFSSPTDSMWEFSGFLDMSTDVAAPGYIIDVDCWLVYNDISGVQVTSEMSTSSGRLNASSNYRAPVTLTAAIPAGRPVQLVVQTFGRDSDLTVSMFGGLAAARLIGAPATPPTALMGVRPWSADGFVPIPSQGTDTYMIWTGDYREEDTYKRGLVVAHNDGIWAARVDRPAGIPGDVGGQWDRLSPSTGGLKGAAFNLAKVTTADSVPTLIPPSVTPQGPMYDVHMANGVIYLDVPGTWLIAGTVQVSSDSPTPVGYTIDTWVEWTNSSGGTRTTPKTTNDGDAGAEDTFTNRFDFTAIFTEPTEIRVYAETLQIDELPANLDGFLSASLLMERGF